MCWLRYLSRCLSRCRCVAWAGAGGGWSHLFPPSAPHCSPGWGCSPCSPCSPGGCSCVCSALPSPRARPRNSRNQESCCRTSGSPRRTDLASWAEAEAGKAPFIWWSLLLWKCISRKLLCPFIHVCSRANEHRFWKGHFDKAEMLSLIAISFCFPFAIYFVL